jgi:hypothetical protein
MGVKLLKKALLFPFLFTAILFSHNIDPIYAQEFESDASILDIFQTIENAEIGIKISYPEDWTIKYKKNNNSAIVNPEAFQRIIEIEEERLKSIGEDLNQIYPTDVDKYEYFLELINNDCIIVTDCRIIEDTYFRSYMLDSKFAFVSIFDYVPSLSILSPVESSTDSFIENVKVASFELPYNSTLAELADYLYLDQLYYFSSFLRESSYDIDSNCQSNVSEHFGCEIRYTFSIGNSIEDMEYTSWQFFTQKNDRIYLISYNILRETDLNYLELVKEMLKSFQIL